MRTLSKATLIALAAAAALASAACNSVAGAGRDVQSAGSAVENAAHETQQDMQDPHS
jgi:predicted small secreted protein